MIPNNLTLFHPGFLMWNTITAVKSIVVQDGKMAKLNLIINVFKGSFSISEAEIMARSQEFEV